MTDLVYFFAAPAAFFTFVLLYKWAEREWVNLTTEEIHKIWDANVDKFGTVENFARALEAELQERNT